MTLMCGLRPGECLPKGLEVSHNLWAHCRSLFRDSDTTDEDAEEFTGFTGGLEDLESDEDEVEEYVPLLPSQPNHL